jgi:hypothetical protein
MIEDVGYLTNLGISHQEDIRRLFIEVQLKCYEVNPREKTLKIRYNILVSDRVQRVKESLEESKYSIFFHSTHN